MGVVGLNFGSPTSGEGFDVSKTVSQIVANLQNVETPWKTQLTTLKSQDTTISSLGTLLSKLSTDIAYLTDATGAMAVKEGSSSDESVLHLTAASTSAVAGTHTVKVTALAVTSSGSLTEIANDSDTLAGSISIKVGSGTAQDITLDSSDNTLSGLASAINSAGIGVTASVLKDASGARLSLVSGTSGANGTLTVTSSITDTSNANAAVNYDTSTAIAGSNGTIVVDSVSLSVSSNTVSDLIPGVTFQLLSKSDTPVQVVIANYNAGVESSVNALVSDYNALISAIDTQEGYDSSGNAEPLYGSPTLTMLQQNILGGINTINPNGYLAPVDDSLDPALSGSISIARGSGTALKVVIGAVPSEADGGAADNTIYTGSGVNTLSGLVDTINSANKSTALGSNTTEGKDASESTSATTSTATLTAVPNYSGSLSGSFSVKVGSGTAENIVIGAAPSTGAAANTIYTGKGVNTIDGVASAINNASTTLKASVTVGTDASESVSATTSMATLTSTNAGAHLSGSISVKVGNGTVENIVIGPVPSEADGGAAANTIYTGSGVNTLSGLVDTINGDTSLGLTAAVTTAADGSQTLKLTSGTSGSAGTLTVTPTMAASLGFTADITRASDGSKTLNLTSGVSGSAGTLTVSTGTIGSNGMSVIPTLYANGLGVTAAVATNNGKSSLTLASQTNGSNGAVTVTSRVVATSDTALDAAVTAGSDAVPLRGISAVTSSATLTAISNADDRLSGSIVIQEGPNDTEHTITLNSSNNTLSGLAQAINDAKIGVTADVTTINGKSTLKLTSDTPGADGTLSVTSNILDTTNTSTANLAYTSSSDIGSLSALGVSVKANGTISLNATTLDSVLNSDYSSVAGFFQNANSWGKPVCQDVNQRRHQFVDRNSEAGGDSQQQYGILAE